MREISHKTLKIAQRVRDPSRKLAVLRIDRPVASPSMTEENSRSPDQPIADSPHSQLQSSPTPLPSCCHPILSSSAEKHSHHDHTSAPIPKPQQAYFSPYTRHPPPSSSPVTTSTETLNECCAPIRVPGVRPAKKMGLSKTQRICILLGIDAVFFLIELVVGEYNTCVFERRANH